MTEKKFLRSQGWFGRRDKMGFYYRSFLKNRGFPQDQFEGRPVIGICNTWSELNPCNSHFRTIAEHVRYGVLDVGGFPLEFPVSSLGEVTMRPTAMLFRNLAAMDVEEGIRAHPLEVSACRKTPPSRPSMRAAITSPAWRAGGSWRWSTRIWCCPKSSPAAPSRTPSGRSQLSAAPPTLSSICSPLPAGSVWSCPWTILTALAAISTASLT